MLEGCKNIIYLHCIAILAEWDYRHFFIFITGRIGGIAITQRSIFWATVCKTMRPMPSDRCPVCPVLSVMLVYCGQTAGRIKMKLGAQVGLNNSHIVLDGDPLRHTDTTSNFRPVSVVAKRLDGLRCHLARR